MKLNFPFVRYNLTIAVRLMPPVVRDSGAARSAPGLATSRLFTGVNGLTVMPVSLPQETQDIKDRREPWSLTEADMHTPVTAGKNILTHLQYAPLGRGHGVHFMHPGCEGDAAILSRTLNNIRVTFNAHTRSAGQIGFSRCWSFLFNLTPLVDTKSVCVFFSLSHTIDSLLLNQWSCQPCWDAS